MTERYRDTKTLVLAFVVALTTFIALFITSLALFTGGGIIYPMFVAWTVASLFALSRQPRYLWFQVGVLGVLVAMLVNLYIAALPILYPPPPGAPPGGPNVNPPPGLTPIPPR